jgi:hypothetical protein
MIIQARQPVQVDAFGNDRYGSWFVKNVATSRNREKAVLFVLELGASFYRQGHSKTRQSICGCAHSLRGSNAMIVEVRQNKHTEAQLTYRLRAMMEAKTSASGRWWVALSFCEASHALSSLANLSDLGGPSSATIKPAGRDLGRTTGPMCASAEAGGEGMDLTDATAADGLRWLRPRDVRSDSAGRRPPEMRRSCQPKAIGCGGGPDNLCLATDAFCSCDNSENSKTRHDVSASH